MQRLYKSNTHSWARHSSRPISRLRPAEDMVAHLANVNEKLVSNLTKARDLAGDQGDNETEDLMIARIQIHEKHIWMLKSYLAA